MGSPDEIKNEEVESKAIFNISGVDDYFSQEKGPKTNQNYASNHSSNPTDKRSYTTTHPRDWAFEVDSDSDSLEDINPEIHFK